VRINVAVPETHVSPDVLNAALETTTRVNESLFREGQIPSFDEAVASGVRWKPEPPGQEHFDHAGIVIGRKWGDCDDLAPYRAAELRVTGEDPGARAVVKKSGPMRWHAIVQRSDGRFEDPSLEAGMGQHSTGAMMSGLPRMPVLGSDVGAYLMRPQLALRPVEDRQGHVEAWQSRLDLPWHWLPGKSPTDVAMVSLHAAPVSSQAVVGAAIGAQWIADVCGLPEEYVDRCGAIAMGCQGASWEEIAGTYDERHANAASQIVGSFFDSIMKPIKKVVHAAASPLGQTAISFVPGVGPVAATALKYSDPILQKAIHSGKHIHPAKRKAFLEQPRIAPGLHLHCTPM
jgi:hypothetical protein